MKAPTFRELICTFSGPFHNISKIYQISIDTERCRTTVYPVKHEETKYVRLLTKQDEMITSLEQQISVHKNTLESLHLSQTNTHGKHGRSNQCVWSYV